MNREQQKRRKVRDRKKKWDMIVSSLQSQHHVFDMISDKVIREVVMVASELGLTVVALVALQALKINDMQRQADYVAESCVRAETEAVRLTAELKKAQELYAKKHVRAIRRGSKKVRKVVRR